MSDKLTAAKSKTGDRSHTPANDRRDFIKKGALAAPLIASVASRPVWACSVSGHMSGNLSHHSADACTAPANCENWSYWAQWREIYDIIDTPNRTWAEASVSVNNGTEFDMLDKYSPINALYNWYLADSTTLDNLAPTDGAGNISAKGSAIGNMAQMKEMRFVAGLLNAAHPNIEFPYTNNIWKVEYISEKYASVDDDAALDDLLYGFFENTYPQTAQLGLIPTSTKEQSYRHARRYLFGIVLSAP